MPSSRTPSARRRTKPAVWCSFATGAQNATSPVATRPHRRTGSSWSSTIRRSGSRKTPATSSPSSIHTSPHRLARPAWMWRTSGSGRASPTSSTRCNRTIWPPSGSKTARSRSCRLLRDGEVTAHAGQVMWVTLIRIAAGPELDRPDHVALERDSRLPVHEPDRGPRDRAWPEEMEVVDRGLVLDLDPVRAGLDRLEVVAGPFHLDGVAGANLADEDGA